MFSKEKLSSLNENFITYAWIGDEKHMQREMKSVNNIFGDFLVKSGCMMK